MTNPDHNQLGPLEALALQAKHEKRPPLSSWSSGVARDFPLRISRDGRWHYLGSPIERASLVKLLSRVLVREGDEFFLVSPEEKLRIEIEDAPFLAVEMEQIGSGDRQKLVFRTNVDDVVIAGVDHKIWVNEHPKTQAPSPYIEIRDGLHALISRTVFYDLAERAIGASGDAENDLCGVMSDGYFFALTED
ncbi:DUF1285 domain-containing protein [Gammaproteobacteria bacterium]|nr:DUF1285 domain-containing protein [Gammaproteobacteria bacterium]MDC3279931.1 DUF1285 domain-containing protein [Gammaproteobacteria bacterium]